MAGTSNGHEATRPFSALQVPLLAGVINHLHKNLKDGHEAEQKMENNQMFKLFHEEQYHRTKQNLAQSFQDTVSDCSASHVSSFILSVLYQGRFSVTECIISMFYLSRFKSSSKITLHAAIWRPLFLTALLISDKVWQDTPVRNSALTKIFPVLCNAELKKLEYEFVVRINFEVNVTPDSFRSFCETLLSERVISEIQEHVLKSDFVRSLGGTSQQGNDTEPLHEDNILANRVDGDHSTMPELAPSPRFMAWREQASYVDALPVTVVRPGQHSDQASPASRGQPWPMRVEPARHPGGIRANSAGCVASHTQDSGNRRSPSMGSLAVAGTPSASGRLGATIRATPLTPTSQVTQSAPRRGISPITPDGGRHAMQHASADTASTPGTASNGSVPRPMGSSGVPFLSATAGGYPGAKSVNAPNREASSPKGPTSPAALRSGAPSTRDASSPKSSAPTTRSGASPHRESAVSGGSSGASAPSLGCSSSAATSTARSPNGTARDPHAMSFQQKQQLFAKTKPVEGSQRQTLRDRAAAALQGPRADSAPAGTATRPSATASKSNAAARVAGSSTGGTTGVRAVVAKFSSQAQEPAPPQAPLAATRCHSDPTTRRSPQTAAPAPGASYGLSAPRSALQAQRSRATVPTLRPSAHQASSSSVPAYAAAHVPGSASTAPQVSANSPSKVGSPQPCSTATAVASSVRSPAMMLNSSRGRSSSPSYLLAEPHAGSLPTTARTSARLLGTTH